jgi:hypothetical protein
MFFIIHQVPRFNVQGFKGSEFPGSGVQVFRLLVAGYLLLATTQ